MANLNRALIYLKAIDVNGNNMQKIVAIEELSELQKELTKDLRYIGSRKNIVEEMADVCIMLDQLKIMYRVTDEELNDEIDFKLVRLTNRLNEGD